MTTSEKPTQHLEGLVLEAEVKQGGTPPKEFRKVKMGNLWLSCWTPGLYPLMVKGKYLAVDYITSQRGAFTNYNIQQATEMVAPAPPATGPSEAPGSPSEAPSPWGQAQDAKGASIEAQVAAYCTAQVVAATIQYGEGGFEIHEIPELIAEFYQGMQEAKAGKHTGRAAPTTGEVDSNLSPDSSAKPTTRPSRHPDSEAGPGAAPPPKLDISIGAFWKGWKEAKLPTTNKGVEELISQATGGKALQVQQAQDIGWRLDELLAKVLEVKEKP